LSDPRRGTPSTEEPARPTLRWPFALLAYLFVALALLGVLLPGLPTFPFLLLAAWAAARGSRRLHDWLYDHPHFGPALVQWRDEGAISRRSRFTAVALIIVSWLLLLWRVGDLRILVPLALLFTVVSTFLLTRPSPSGDRSDDPDA
jgi:uncharacterized membrane protein YbaN (DUF454 family)